MKKNYRKNIVALNSYSRRAGEGRNEVLEQGRGIQASSRREFLVSELENVRVLLDQGLASNAQTKLASIMKAAQHEPSLLAQARCALSVALETQGRYRESLEIVSRYEFSESRTMLDQDTRVSVLVHAGLANNYIGDQPKAIALLNAALREALDNESDTQAGYVYIALARVYRSINEYFIARDYAQKALEHFRHTGDWRGLAESWFGIGAAEFFEGRYEGALSSMAQSLKLIGGQPANYLLGKIYNNMAAACWFLRRPHEGIGYLERAIDYYERTEHKANAMDGYNNLGINLIVVGNWNRAQVALDRALEIASGSEERRAVIATILDSHGELQMLRGNLNEAERLLARAVEIATESGNKWYQAQALRTLGRCYISKGEIAKALKMGEQALALGERISDRQAICESRLLLAEAQLEAGRLDECANELQTLAEETKDSPEDLAIAGEAQRLHGLIALAQHDTTRAAQHFGRGISIFEMLGDIYRSTLAHYLLGRAYAATQPERAAEHLTLAVESFQRLGAGPALARAETALAQLDRSVPARQEEVAALIQMLTLRLSEAVASRELLLRELAAVLREETGARRVLILEPHRSEAGQNRIVTLSGWTESEGIRLMEQSGRTGSEAERELFAAQNDLSVITLKPLRALPATLLIAPRDSARLPFGLTIDPLLRVVELGLSACALQEKEDSGQDGNEQAAAASQSLMPGFIHSSPAMTRLVEEIYKIRSSDVTVLVTGESGTGKELVARAVHAVSSRRSKVFVPFNCTAVPKELSDAFLFGYKRGAFTGAVADSAGVIRAAEGGTLFLDEVGDLPLEIQPKLLRFLQEGEIQPLGEHRPTRVDVRVIAATNTDLEEMVAAGRFREDLYYRLNVIRLHVPPLRERRSEIPAIVNHYIRHYSEKFGRRDIQISPQALDLLMVCDWPGNVRQLTNELQRIVARAEDSTLITPNHLSPELRRTAPAASFTASTASAAGEPFWQNMTLAEATEHLERIFITEVLRKHKGNITRAARELEMTRRGLQLKLARLNLSADN